MNKLCVWMLKISLESIDVIYCIFPAVSKGTCLPGWHTYIRNPMTQIYPLCSLKYFKLFPRYTTFFSKLIFPGNLLAVLQYIEVTMIQMVQYITFLILIWHVSIHIVFLWRQTFQTDEFSFANNYFWLWYLNYIFFVKHCARGPTWIESQIIV